MTTPSDAARAGEREAAPCECGRRPVSVVAFKRNTSLLIRRIGDMGHASAADHRCTDCVAEMADEVAACPIRPFHPDFARCQAVDYSHPHRQCALSAHSGAHSFTPTDPEATL